MSLPTMIRMSGILFVAAFSIFVFGILGFLAGPQIQAYAFPVIKAASIAGSVVRDRSSVCWSTHFLKNWPGTPAYFDYRIVSRGDRITVAPYKIETSGRRVYLSTYGFAYHAAGSVWDSRYCVDIPSGVDTSRPFMIEGDSVYDTPNPFWQVRAPLPSFEVPGLP